MNLCTVLGISLWRTALDSPQDNNNRVFRRQHVLHDGAGGDSESQSAYLLCLWQWGCGESFWLMIMLIMDSRNEMVVVVVMMVVVMVIVMSHPT